MQAGGVDHGVIGRTSEALLERLKGRATLVDSGSRDEIEIEAPFSGEVLGNVPRCTGEDVREATRRARAAQELWARTSFGERARIFMRFHDLVLERQDEALDVVQLETGKARGHAFEEVLDVAVVARYYARSAARLLRPRRLPAPDLDARVPPPQGCSGLYRALELPPDARRHRRDPGSHGR